MDKKFVWTHTTSFPIILGLMSGFDWEEASLSFIDNLNEEEILIVFEEINYLIKNMKTSSARKSSDLFFKPENISTLEAQLINVNLRLSLG